MDDLKDLRPTNEGHTVKLTRPDGRPLMKGDKQLWIKVGSSDSPAWRKVELANQNKRIELANMARGARVKVTAQQMEADVIACLAAVTQEWGEIYLDGQELGCTVENAAKLYREIPLIYEQVLEAARDRSNFLKGDTEN